VIHTHRPIALRILILAFPFLTAMACQSDEASKTPHTPQTISSPQKSPGQSSIEASRAHLEVERKKIEAFMDTNKLGWESTGTGMFYTVLKPSGETRMAQSEELVTFEYKTLTLDGQILYSSEETGPRKLRLDVQDSELGLHDALKRIHLMDEALFILPSHLAYGVAGDQKRVPARAPLLYEIKIIEIN
jgi:FKBP-type peptidyl-prolyl cis-trans isomerase